VSARAGVRAVDSASDRVRLVLVRSALRVLAYAAPSGKAVSQQKPSHALLALAPVKATG